MREPQLAAAFDILTTWGQTHMFYIVAKDVGGNLSNPLHFGYADSDTSRRFQSAVPTHTDAVSYDV